jgi:hypothetical protein
MELQGRIFLITVQSRIICLTTALLFIASIVSADVTIDNSYFVDNGDVREIVSLHEMDYSNSVQITKTSFYAESEAFSAEKSENSKFEHAFFSNSQGASLKASAKNLMYNKRLYGGNVDGGEFTYSMDSGDSQVAYYTPTTSVSENIVLANSQYGATFGVANSKLHSGGKGKSNSNAPSSFSHDISLLNNGIHCNIKSFLMSEGKSSSNIPVSYQWSSSSFGVGNAFSVLKIAAYQGNRAVDLGIKGSSSFLSDKYSPDSYAKGTPAHMDPIGGGTRESRELYMQYSIS